MVEAELTEHPGYERRASEGRSRGNASNGGSAKTLVGQQGKSAYMEMARATGSPEQFRAPADAERPAALAGLGSQHYLDLCPTPEHA